MKRVPVSKPRPDAGRFIRCMMGEEVCGKPPLVEYIVDPVVMKPIVRDLLDRPWAEPEWGDRQSKEAYLDNFIAFWHRMGYDFVRLERSLPFGERHIYTEDTAEAAVGERGWADEHKGPIMSWDDFEAFDWPDPAKADFHTFEYLDSHLPEGMGLISCHAGGQYEHLTRLMSYEGLSIALHDNPELVRSVSDRVGELITGYYERLLQFENLIAVLQGDDMGFRTGTLISPDHLREFVLPWHRRYAGMAHEKGLPYFLHSCGNVTAIMDDLIEDVGIDGKHSFEDAVMPVADFQERYGKRIAVMGGIDINILAGGDLEKLRSQVRRTIDTCGPRGRYAIGSGNSVPSYVPVKNYLTMIDEALA